MAVESASNLGTGAGAFKQRVIDDLEFKSVIGSQGLAVTASATELSIGYAGIITADDTTVTADSTTVDASYLKLLPAGNTGVNVGTGVGLFKERAEAELRFKTLTGGPCVSVTDAGDEVVIGLAQIITADTTQITADTTEYEASDFAVCPEANDGRNVGPGAGLFRGKNGPILEFKSLAGGNGVEIVHQDDRIVINADTLPWFNVRDYGAAGDGLTDDTEAIFATIAAIPPFGGVLYFPAGTYLVSNTLAVTERQVTIRGDGYGVSVIKWSTPGCVLISNALHKTKIEGLSLVATVANAGTAIAVVGTPGTTEEPFDQIGVTIEDVWITGEGEGFWDVGVKIVDCPRSTVRNLQIDGSLGGADVEIKTQAGLLLQSDIGVAGFTVTGMQASFCEFGVLVASSDVAPADVGIDNSRFVNCATGVRIAETVIEPPARLQIANCRFSTRDCSIQGPAIDSTIADCIFADTTLVRPAAADTKVRYAFIFLGRNGQESATQPVCTDPTVSANLLVHDNVIRNPNGTDTYGIIIGKDVCNAVVTSNILRLNIPSGAARAAIRLENNAVETVLRHNNILGQVTPYEDRSVRTAIGFRGAFIFRDGDGTGDILTVGGGTSRLIDFPKAQFDTEGFIPTDSSSAAFRIPPNRGIRRVRVTVFVGATTTTETGSVGIGIGSTPPLGNTNISGNYLGRASDKGRPVNIAATGSPVVAGVMGLTAQTAIIDVFVGQPFNVFFENASGSDAYIQGGKGRSWMQIEVIE